jgi:hypothetical protein
MLDKKQKMGSKFLIPHAIVQPPGISSKNFDRR